MDLIKAITERRSCRDFLPEPVAEEVVNKIIQAGIWAPSPMNAQPWEFITITSQEVKDEIYNEAEERRKWLVGESGWKWLESYQVDFVRSAPVIIAVVGDPERTGADRFLEGGGMGYQHACAAASQNMLLAAYSLGLGSVWVTLFDVNAMRAILDVNAPKVPFALICLGKAKDEQLQSKRKDLLGKTRFM